MTRITIMLSDQERNALFELSQRELRPLPDQARFILRNVLIGEQQPTTEEKNKSAVNPAKNSHSAFAASHPLKREFEQEVQS